MRAMSDIDEAAARAEIERLREEIERIDRELIALIAERVRVACTLVPLKKAAGLPTLDPAREAAVIRRAGTFAREFGLGEDGVRNIFWHLIGFSRQAQIDNEP